MSAGGGNGGGTTFTLSMVLQSQEKYGRVFSEPLSTPDRIHFVITRLIEYILEVCEKANIDIWLDAGTLLGHKRDGGVILWDYDGDLCAWIQDRDRLSAAFDATPPPADLPVIVDRNGYNEPSGAWWIKSAFSDLENPGVDIVFYEHREQEQIVATTMSPQLVASSPCAFNYSFPSDMIFPMTRELFLGRRAMAISGWDRYLTGTYAVYGGTWRVPVKSPASWIVPRFHVPSTTAVQSYSGVDTVEALLAVRERHVADDTPFILRRTALLDLSPEAIKRATAMQRDEVEVFRHPEFVNGPRSMTGTVDRVPLSEVLDQMDSGKLKCKVLDAMVNGYVDILPTEWLAAAVKNLGSERAATDNALCWHLVQDGESPWHMDAVDNDHTQTHLRSHELPHAPGGFVRLFSGEKTWWFIPKKIWSQLLDPAVATSNVAHAIQELYRFNLSVDGSSGVVDIGKHKLTFSIGELLQAEPEILWGNIYTTVHQAGDLIWFPTGCLHKVSTQRPAFGMGGYI